jgi:hypothetical protein
MPAGNTGFPSHDAVGTARDDIFRRMINYLGGNPLGAVTGNTTPQFLLDGGVANVRIPANWCDLSQRGTISGGIRFRMLLGVKNNSGAGRVFTFGFQPLSSGNLNLNIALPSLASDNVEYQVIIESTVFALGGVTKTNAFNYHDMVVWNGAGLVQLGGGPGTPTIIRRGSLSSGDLSAVQTPLLTASTDAISAQAFINLYAIAIETMASQASFGA